LTRTHEGWDWFEPAGASPDDVAAAHEADTELARAFGSCFRGSHGSRVLKHLRTLTLDRVLGPESPDTLLRYVEGQRQLVAYICTLVERANRGPAATGVSSGATTRENEMEQP
jgi:hypothetical protein